MKLSKTQTAIILPLKESFNRENSGAVSVWVKYYLKYSKKLTRLFFVGKFIKIKGIFIKMLIPFLSLKEFILIKTI